ncbi:MAG TPA: histidine--tRNA ligase [Candidatus Deferrimicrobium sp.]|nr:histidine--tRNA ligase [Candidatus Deferrimicrobium sp.]
MPKQYGIELKMDFQTVKGMRDLLPEDFQLFKHVISVVRQLFDLYNYQEVAMPIVESFELLAAKSGEEIKDTMYVFKDKADRKLALRPEMTASVARLYINEFMKSAKKPLRLAYIGTCYRYDNPQYGRYREFRQAGFELIGSNYPEADAEILIVCDDLMSRLGFDDFKFKVGHVGILREILEQEGLGEEIQNKVFSLIDRDKLDEAYQLFRKHKLSNDSVEIIKELMHLKGEHLHEIIERALGLVKNYPKAQQAIQNIKEILTLYLSASKIERIFLDLGFARGLEYYTGMIFEIIIPNKAIAVGGGGRYDKLIETFHGDSTPAVGCAPGIDRIVLTMKEQNLDGSSEGKFENKIMLTCIDENLLPEAIKLLQTLRKNNFNIEFDVGRKKLKKLLSFVASKKMQYTIIFGPEEMIRNEVIVRNMTTEQQEPISIDKIVDYLKEKMVKV